MLLVVRATEPLTDEAARESTPDSPPLGYFPQTGPSAQQRHAPQVVAVDPGSAAPPATRRRCGAGRCHPARNPTIAALSLFTTAADISILEAAICDIADRTATAAHAAGRLIPDQDALHADALIALARYWLHDTWPIPEPDPRQQPNT